MHGLTLSQSDADWVESDAKQEWGTGNDWEVWRGKCARDKVIACNEAKQLRASLSDQQGERKGIQVTGHGVYLFGEYVLPVFAGFADGRQGGHWRFCL